MDLLREQIVERIRGRRNAGVPWVLDVYWHLVNRGATPDQASQAMSEFVDDLIATKIRRPERA